MNNKEKKAFYKKLWFWYFVIVGVVIIMEVLDKYLF